MSTQEFVQPLVMFFIPFVISIGIHEWAHVAMARFLGDDTGTRMGRYTLNPLAHLDPVWTVIVPLIMLFKGGMILGAGKPAPYTPRNLDREFGGKRITLRAAEMLVAAAGPISNMVLAVVCVLVFVPLRLSAANEMLQEMFLMAGLLNVALAVFNLIPVDPLDGAKVIRFFLPYNATQKFDAFMARGGFFLMIGAFLLASFVIGPAQRVYMQFLHTVLGWFA